MKFLAKYKDGLIMITWVLVCVSAVYFGNKANAQNAHLIKEIDLKEFWGLK